MIQLYSLQSRALPERHGIWLAIRDSGATRHTGIVFRLEANAPALFLHLGFHHELHCEPLAASYAWLECPGFSADEQLQIAVWLETIWSVNREFVPYGITFSGAGYFDRSTGRFVASATGNGLTCATFVMAVFSDFFFPIVEWTTWPSRGSDAEFHQYIVDILESRVKDGRATREHVDMQIDAIGHAPRFRPEEVVAAGGGYLGNPLTFETSELLSRHLLHDLSVAF